ncbi:hypothetical protein DAETH_23620 [Deinococcus aetherius]|uniref:DUF3995 domain-containing protein n=1 Tax=Deinococcus aetherius TaxID=200252 RepID=A0ABM8AF15_9DEIO|nr:hypothetical protein DAETH_23620 [Deinococcus aetherius]
MPRVALSPLQLACVLGLIHAAFSLYWALGGRWLLETVGQGPRELLKSGPLSVGASLGLIALFKAAAAILPVLNGQDRLPWPKLWRGISWVGGVFLILYGGVNTLVAWGVLSGLVASPGYNRSAMLGHAALWDPLFLLWGAALVLHLWLSRPVRT